MQAGRQVKVKRKNFLLRREIFFSLLLSCFFIVIIMSFTLLPIFTNTQIKTTADYMTAQLKQITYSANVMFDEAKNVISTTYTDINVKKSMYNWDTNRLEEVDAVNRLRAIKSSHPYVLFIGVYNERLSRYITTGGVFTDLDEYDPNIVKRSQQGGFVSYARSTGVLYPFAENQAQVHTFSFIPEYSKTYDSKSFVVVDMNASYLQTLIQNMSVENQEQEIMVINEKNIIVSHTNSSLFLTNAAKDGKEFFPTLMQESAKQSEGSFTYKDDDGKKMFITYVKNNNNDWLYVSKQPYALVVNNTSFITNLTILLAGLLIIIGYLFSLFMVKKIHNPIKQLYDRVAVIDAGNLDYRGDNLVKSITDKQNERGDITNEVLILGSAFESIVKRSKSMENSFNSSLSVLKFTHLKFLIEGNLVRVDKSASIYDELGIKLNSPYYAVVIIEYCDLAKIKSQLSPKDQILFGYAVENVATELLSEVAKTDFLHFSENRFVAILHLEEIEIPYLLDEAIEQIIEVMIKEFNVEMRGCIGTVWGSYKDIHRSYEDAVSAIQSRVAISDERVIDAKTVLSSPKVKQFPTVLQNKLIDNIKQKNEQYVNDTVDEIVGYLSDISWNYAVNYSKQILLAVFSRFDSFIDKDSKNHHQLLRGVEKIELAENLYQLKDTIRSFSLVVTSLVTVRKKDSGSDVVAKVKEYTKVNFSSFELNLNSMAQHVGLSPAYFGRMFAATTGISYIDYLNSVRVEAAADILRTTKSPVGTISEMVGIANTNYFYTVFKKKYGCTPAVYRKENQQGGALQK